MGSEHAVPMTRTMNTDSSQVELRSGIQKMEVEKKFVYSGRFLMMGHFTLFGILSSTHHDATRSPMKKLLVEGLEKSTCSISLQLTVSSYLEVWTSCEVDVLFPKRLSGLSLKTVLSTLFVCDYGT